MSSSIKFNVENCYISENNKNCLIIKGWAFSSDIDDSIEFLVSDLNCKLEINNYNRNDVQLEFPQQSNALKSGFTLKIFKIKSRIINLILKSKKNEENIIKINVTKARRKYQIMKFKAFIQKISIKNFVKVFVNLRKYGLKYTIFKIKSRFSKRGNNDFAEHERLYNNIEIQKNIYIENLFKVSSSKSDNYIEISNKNIELKQDDIKYIAFYLPQFHPIKENDLWWGKGFTEWTNVSKAVPQFVGHYQPHLPGELGFYDLRIIDVMKRQAELAKQYGIYGFCFHHYWFGGKRLLEKPVKQLLANPEIDISFCLCWANENWTRAWDGYEKNVLISQSHSPEDDINFIEDVISIFQDKRYIRISNKPVLIVYRPKLLPNPKDTVKRWREHCKNAGLDGIYLIAVQGFGLIDPKEVDFDAAVEFPPHSIFNDCPNITEHINVLNNEFKGTVLDYTCITKNKNYLENTPYKLYKTVSPSWDNTARKPKGGTIFHGSSPELYKQWLIDVSLLTRKKMKSDEQLVFINAWNEWAEGTHLEPDRKYGYAYLQSTSEALLEYRKNKLYSKSLIYVGHDANFNGAQILTLNIIKILSEKFKYNVHLILKTGGVLEKEYIKYAEVYNIDRDYKDYCDINSLIEKLHNQGTDIAITNTVISGDIVDILVSNHIRTISLIHELTQTIKFYKAEDYAKSIAQYSDKVIFPSEFVRQGFEQIVNINKDKVIICPQGLYKSNKRKNSLDESRIELRKFLKINSDSDIILGVGFADHRKGIDLFIETANKVNVKSFKTYFVWVGNRDEELIEKSLKNLKIDIIKSNIIFIDAQDDVSLFYAGADLYLMTSREDPFPSVILEAMEVGLPVIGFNDAGGFVDIIDQNTGDLVPYLDTDKMADSVIRILKDDHLKTKIKEESPRIIESKFRFIDYIYKLLSFLGHEYKKVSVIVPNYNYGNLITDRLNTIVNQNYPLYDVIVLDDCSTDNSISIINNYKKKIYPELYLYSNKKNSGAVFRQWAKGIGLAKGEYVWIAEADDLCCDEFLENVMNKFYDDSEVVLSYCQSNQMASDGSILAHNYIEYTDDIDKEKWLNDYVNDGIKEIREVLAVKNAIPNVSATVFRKVNIDSIIENLCNYKIAGDWYFYVWILQKGKIAFTSKSLNYHRRHINSVTASEKKQLHFDEIVKMQDYIIKNHEISVKMKDKIYEYRKKVRDIIFKG